MHRKPPQLEALLALPDQARAVGPFHLVRPLGSGGFAPVWLAEERYGGRAIRNVAIKLFALGENKDAVIDEAHAVCRVEHPNVVRFFTLAIDDARGVMGLAMEYVDGVSVDHRLTETHGALPLEEALAVGIAVASALDAVHRAGLVHRDVKPANVVRASGVFKLIDFGVALGPRAAPRPVQRAIVLDDLPIEIAGTKASEVLRLDGSASYVFGTVGYICPHCLQGGRPTSATCDLYSLGATLFQCISGALPSVVAARNTGASGLAGDVLDGRAPAPSLASVAPWAPRTVIDVVDAMLAPDPARRPPSAGLVAHALEQGLAEARRLRTGDSAPIASAPIASAPIATAPIATAPTTIAATPKSAMPLVLVIGAVLAVGLLGIAALALVLVTRSSATASASASASSPPASSPPALAAPTTSAAETGIPPECTRYLAVYQCLLHKTTVTQIGGKTDPDAVITSLRTMYENVSKTPSGRASIALSCEQSHQQIAAAVKQVHCPDPPAR